jgi:hypothetical protein
MDDKRLFEALKREGECWHEPEDCPAGILPDCKHCGATSLWTGGVFKNPNFSNPTWNTFGWAWERAQEKEWWAEFIFRVLGRIVPKGYISRLATQGYAQIGMEQLIHPARFISALKEFLEKEAK